MKATHCTLSQVIETTRQKNKDHTVFGRRLPTLPEAPVDSPARDGEKRSSPRAIKDCSLDLMREDLNFRNVEMFRVSHHTPHVRGSNYLPLRKSYTLKVTSSCL